MEKRTLIVFQVGEYANRVCECKERGGILDDEKNAEMQKQQWQSEKDTEMGSSQETLVVGDKDFDGNKEEKDEQVAKLPFTRARCIALVMTVTTAAFLNTMGIQSAVIILPAIGRELNIPNTRQQWIVSAYNLTFGCFLLLCGRIADVYSKRSIFIWGSAWATLTSILVPFARNEIAFDVLRGLQGLGAAAMVPTAIGILGVTFPQGKAKNYAFSCYGAGSPLGTIFGQIFGGLVGEYLDWRWVFWIFGILAALCTVSSICFIPTLPAPSVAGTVTTLTAPSTTRNSIDWLGGAIITTGLVLLLFALSEGNVVGWRTPWVSTILVLSILLILVFGTYQHWLETKITRNPNGNNQRPLMKISMFRNVRFTAANIVMMLYLSSFNNFLIYASFWFQEYQGLSVIQTTLRLLPLGVAGFLVSLLTSILLPHLRTRTLLQTGTLSLTVASLLFALPLPSNLTYWAYAFPATILAVVGADTLYPTLTLFASHCLPTEDQALGGALINSAGQVGRAIFLAVGTAVQAGVMEGTRWGVGEEGLRDGIRATCWFDVGLGGLALLVVVIFFNGKARVGGIKGGKV
ncbi:unnamed protein product [Periconia digitata]|uniref:Major facilitator superfamily (MFS) profile domain-containing protein n=1 Tax=Periconia digitata TaxID=1303443 RepID=A0A9W4U8F3_9PLEO|nr:unnamed protein product [Periconia digitata]